jgi:Chlorophyll A-B binding protein
MNSKVSIVLLVASLFHGGHSFQPSAFGSRTAAAAAPKGLVLHVTKEEAEKKADEYEEPKLTDKGLPELKGDFDWDAKFADDEDWITEDVPGKIVLDDITLAKQVTALDKLETQWRKERLQREYEESKKVGFVAEAELANGRFAMFFLLTGLLTELWTGISIPGQVEEMLRIGGIIGFDG